MGNVKIKKGLKCILVVMVSLIIGGCEKEFEEIIPQEDIVYEIKDTYDYSSSVPKSEEKEDSYFDECLIVGDSRVGALPLYGACKNADVAYVSALNLARIESMKLDECEEDLTILDVLNETTKKNIYIMVGINEIKNYNFQTFGEVYQEIIDSLKTNHPESNIFIVLSYHPDKVQGLNEPELSEKLSDLNSVMTYLAERNKIYFLNLDDELDDENGTIKDEYVSDGLHFNKDGAMAFELYLKSHTVDPSSYMKEVEVVK